ncbi:2-oxoglutarate dehydrogenase E1 component [Robbsia sp. Bb-Pol-6]|uniref:oxoglutarate dehydrogenase (succinyl-transferring) n=1 Tax=Robbsia betulipollinis TaxID=2981849 RepID=A0ABT3ZHA3_9BURK|nr:2-oxoglutarate dehydrogenase E1 component [Robbsia betulipollinis]MCY0385909.1 2-oxoglutarate dehydrogenase E1 component [Robbsia betulipollinis]
MTLHSSDDALRPRAQDGFSHPSRLSDKASGRLARVANFIAAYREHGYRVARIDPLNLVAAVAVDELTPQWHGLSSAALFPGDAAELDPVAGIAGLHRRLQDVYCGPVGLDASGVRDAARRDWLFNSMESGQALARPSPADQVGLLRRLLAAEEWERVVQRTFPQAKRFSLEGCESMLPLMDTLIEMAALHGIGKAFVGMPHRGRLNTLVNLMGYPPERMMAYLDTTSASAVAQQDLPYHFGGLSAKETSYGKVMLFLAHNPSHLQSVHPVVSGMSRAVSDDDGASGSSCVPIVIHGDAAFAGQGVVMETLNLTQANGYSLGGTIHIVVNNQIGFTTPNPLQPQTHRYCTDIARMIDAPVFHVNADHPEDVMAVARVAFDYRMAFGVDVVIDLVGYRRLGHAEQDIPSVTQAALHAVIDRHPTVTALYGDQMVATDVVSTATLGELRARAATSFHEDARADWQFPPPAVPSFADDARAGAPLSLVRLRELVRAMTAVPAGQRFHDVIHRLIGQWRDAVAREEGIANWCLAENLAYASLLSDGHGVRISGMDVGRGTFMHRHAVWHASEPSPDYADRFVPLRRVAQPGTPFDVVNSPLSEEAVLGFEYGYSTQSRRDLVIWEAQYGDFVNGAQIMIDQYIVSGEAKWGYQSALVILLPHGHEGVGPEHSSGYLSRFLQLCAQDNIRVAFPSNAAQWFHLLRRQALSPQRKPLVVMTPKAQLYANPGSHSVMSELIDGAFQPVLADDAKRDPNRVTRVVLCSGKVFYALQAARDAADTGTGTRADMNTVALLRLELLYPFPKAALAAALAPFVNLAEIVWVQEEDANQGAWQFVRDHLDEACGEAVALRKACPAATPSGARSSAKMQQRDQDDLIAAALGERR